MGKYRTNPSKEYMEYLTFAEIGDADRAAERLRAAADLNDPLALHTLGYEAEEDLADIKRALTLYRRAAREGYEPSMINLARYYETKRNSRWYFFWLKKSAELGSLESKLELSNPFPYLVLTANKLRKKGKLAEAREIYKFCSKLGNLDAMINYANIVDLYDQRRRDSLVESLYIKAIEKGSGLAAFNMAKHCEDRGELDSYQNYMKISASLGYSNERERDDIASSAR